MPIRLRKNTPQSFYKYIPIHQQKLTQLITDKLYPLVDRKNVTGICVEKDTALSTVKNNPPSDIKKQTPLPQ